VDAIALKWSLARSEIRFAKRSFPVCVTVQGAAKLRKRCGPRRAPFPPYVLAEEMAAYMRYHERVGR
jgi:hypothetical protein